MRKLVVLILVLCLGYVSLPNPTLADTAADSDFETRCIGAVSCFGFDNEADTVSHLESELSPEVDYPKPGQWVTDTVASGSGSLKITIPPAGSPADSFVFNFMDDKDFPVQFGEGDVFYVQWRQKFSDGMLLNNFGGDGFKQIIIGEGDREGYVAPGCSEIEVVMYNSYFRGFPQGYHSCGKWVELQERINLPRGSLFRYDYKLQNAIHEPDKIPSDCLWSNNQGSDAKCENCIASEHPPCFGYEPDQWMTFEVAITIGNWNRPNSEIRMWRATEGGGPIKFIDMKNFTLINRSNRRNPAKYGKVHLTPWMTNQTADYPADTWYDELIISRSPIPFPGGSPLP